MSIKEDVEQLLKESWYSNFQLQMNLRSSSADREARRIRENPPEGYVFVQRPKKIVVPGQHKCLEYRLMTEEEYERYRKEIL